MQLEEAGLMQLEEAELMQLEEAGLMQLEKGCTHPSSKKVSQEEQYLNDGFKVELCAIPESELATLSAGNAATAFRRPG